MVLQRRQVGTRHSTFRSPRVLPAVTFRFRGKSCVKAGGTEDTHPPTHVMTSASPPTLAKLGSKLDESVVWTKNGPKVRRVDQFTNSEWLASTYITGVVCQACLPC